MPGGVVFLVCIPTLSYEHELVFGTPVKSKKQVKPSKVDLRLKNSKMKTNIIPLGDEDTDDYDDVEDVDDEIENTVVTSPAKRINTRSQSFSPTRMRSKEPVFISMETVLDELLKKLRVEHVVWCKDRGNMYYEVIFPVPAGDPCENCLHCLTEMGIGIKMNSIVSVIPTQCTYSGVGHVEAAAIKLERERRRKTEQRQNDWTNFVQSIRSKLTVKQVVDGVRSGGDLTFDYILLVLTADMLAGLGLIENSATNVVAAMLVSPLMGPVMSLTFGTIIADRNLQIIGCKSLFLGIFISIVFGFIFGFIIGATEMPWGYNDWPTDEMKGRGNYRSLWMGVLWALPSGVGVAVALLQGSNGPMIGVAISASLLPPVVNCGIFWALACIWLIRRPIKMPHIKGESYTNYNSGYENVYSEWLPLEFFCNGIISACLTFVNVICIFITAIIVLKIKEVAAPYTSTPELRRFWEHDIRLVRDKNISRDNSSLDSSFYDALSKTKKRALERTLNEAVLEAIDDDTFRKVQRASYGQHGAEDISPRIGLRSALGEADLKNKGTDHEVGITRPTEASPNPMQGSTTEDLAALDRLITYLLGQPPTNNSNLPGTSNLDNWQRSFRASARGYRPLRPNEGLGESSTSGAGNFGIGTTPL